MACLWRYHKYRTTRTPVVSKPVGQTQSDLEAALHDQEDKEVPAPTKPSRGRSTKSSASVQAEANPDTDALEA